MVAAFGMVQLAEAPSRSLISLAAMELVSEAAERAQLVVAVDDAQWLDRTRAGDGNVENVTKQAAGDAVTGRFTRPEEVADLVLLLSSERARNVAGADSVIDGGLLTTFETEDRLLRSTDGAFEPRVPAGPNALE